MVDFLATRHGSDLSNQLLRIDNLEPTWTTATSGSLICALYVDVLQTLVANRNLVTNLDLERRDIHLVSIDPDMSVAHELARLSAGHGKSKTEYDVVESALEESQQVFTCNTLLLSSFLEIVAELSLEQIVDTLDTLLFTQLLSVSNQLCATRRLTMLSWRLRSPLFNRTGGLVALLTFQEELHSLTPTKTALFTSISCQLNPPRNWEPVLAPHTKLLDPATLRRTTTIVRNRGDIGDGEDLQARRSQLDREQNTLRAAVTRLTDAVQFWRDLGVLVQSNIGTVAMLQDSVQRLAQRASTQAPTPVFDRYDAETVRSLEDTLKDFARSIDDGRNILLADGA